MHLSLLALMQEDIVLCGSWVVVISALRTATSVSFAQHRAHKGTYFAPVVRTGIGVYGSVKVEGTCRNGLRQFFELVQSLPGVLVPKMERAVLYEDPSMSS